MSAPSSARTNSPRTTQRRPRGGVRTRTQQQPAPVKVHTALTLADRDQLDTLCLRIQSRARILQHLHIDDDDYEYVEDDIGSLCDDLIADSEALEQVLHAAGRRGHDD